jgi:hypothetical protein
MGLAAEAHTIFVIAEEKRDLVNRAHKVFEEKNSLIPVSLRKLACNPSLCVNLRRFCGGCPIFRVRSVSEHLRSVREPCIRTRCRKQRTLSPL